MCLQLWDGLMKGLAAAGKKAVVHRTQRPGVHLGPPCADRSFKLWGGMWCQAAVVLKVE